MDYKEKSVLETTKVFLDKADYFLMSLGFAYLGIYAVQVLAEPPEDIFEVLDLAALVIYLLFLLDLILRFVVAIPTLNKISGWVDFVRHDWLSILALVVPYFRSLRVLRILIILRGIAPYMKNRATRVGTIVAVSLPLVLLTSALAVLEAERYAPNSNITSFGDAIWWSLVSVTTVGYGDSFPVTPEGRAVATLLMFVGIGLFSSLTALVAAWVVKGDRTNSN
jgi:voltage-gated potassium channel